jgi:hypothetical protein
MGFRSQSNPNPIIHFTKLAKSLIALCIKSLSAAYFLSARWRRAVKLAKPLPRVTLAAGASNWQLEVAQSKGEAGSLDGLDGAVNLFICMVRGGNRTAEVLDFDGAEQVGRLIKREFFRDGDRYEEGKCPEFAIALQRVIPGSHLEVCTRSWIDWGGVARNKLSHVVVSSGAFDFDAGGGEAQVRWEGRWDEDYSDKPDEGVEFSWSRISEAALVKRVRKCREDDPELDWGLVEKLSKRMGKMGEEGARGQRALARPKTLPGVEGRGNRIVGR